MDTNRFTIKQWAEEDRPREKMLKKGARALSNAELLAILIGSGNKHLTAVDLSKLILSDVDNNLQELGKKSVSELVNAYNGVGEAKAVTILAAMELGSRRQSEKVADRIQVTSSASVADVFIPLLGELSHEEFWVMYLNRANKVLSYDIISQGGVSGTVVDMKLIFKLALEKLASAIILCHNHPSGNMTASSQDIQITQKCVTAAKALGIDVLDHLIVSHGVYYSFADEGMMPRPE